MSPMFRFFIMVRLVRARKASQTRRCKFKRGLRWSAKTALSLTRMLWRDQYTFCQGHPEFIHGHRGIAHHSDGSLFFFAESQKSSESACAAVVPNDFLAVHLEQLPSEADAHFILFAVEMH